MYPHNYTKIQYVRISMLLLRTVVHLSNFVTRVYRASFVISTHIYVNIYVNVPVPQASFNPATALVAYLFFSDVCGSLHCRRRGQAQPLPQRTEPALRSTQACRGHGGPCVASMLMSYGRCGDLIENRSQRS